MDVLLALGLLLSSATQLRSESVAIGPGEALLALWSALALARATLRGDVQLRPAAIKLICFWSVFSVALCIGSINAFVVRDTHDPKWVLHDVVAYCVVATIACLMALQSDAERHARRVAWYLASIGSALLLIQLAMAYRIIDSFGLEMWEWDRLRGLTDNANQLALCCLVLALLSLHLAKSSGGARRVAAVCFLIVALASGLLSKSDAFGVALLASAGTYLVVSVRSEWAPAARGRKQLTSATMLVALAAPVCAAFLTISIIDGTSLKGMLETFSRGGKTGATEQTAELRFEIWRAAISRGVNVSSLGLGPGPHLEIPESLVAERRDSGGDPKNVIHPQLGAAPNFEAHNTFLDLFLQGGIIADGCLIWLACSTLLALLRQRAGALASLLVGMCVFALFHLIIRHPIVWYAFTFAALIAGEAPSRARERYNPAHPAAA